jgi:hypothetical protein
MYNALLFSLKSPTSFNKLLTSPDNAFEKSSKLNLSSCSHTQGGALLSRKIEAHLLPRCVLGRLYRTLVLIRVLLHNLGRQLSEESSLTIARRPVISAYDGLALDEDLLESIEYSLSTRFFIIHRSPLLRLVGILDQDIEGILHLLDRCQLFSSSFVGRFVSLVLRSVSSLVLRC